MSIKKKLPKDTNKKAKAIVDLVTSEPKPEPAKNEAAVLLGRAGGKKGGPARAKVLSAKRRKEIAMKAAAARWGHKTS